jgi:hypothetical protein
LNLTDKGTSVVPEEDDLYAEGAGLDEDAAVTYLQRARGERKRPAFGWDSLTMTTDRASRLNEVPGPRMDTT